MLWLLAAGSTRTPIFTPPDCHCSGTRSWRRHLHGLHGCLNVDGCGSLFLAAVFSCGAELGKSSVPVTYCFGRVCALAAADCVVVRHCACVLLFVPLLLANCQRTLMCTHSSSAHTFQRPVLCQHPSYIDASMLPLPLQFSITCRCSAATYRLVCVLQLFVCVAAMKPCLGLFVGTRGV